MNAISMQSNMHPVDRLADVRARIRELQATEKELLTQVSNKMGDNASLGGIEWIAKQSLTNRKGTIDTKAAEADGIDLSSYRRPDTAVFTIRVERRENEEAA